MTLKQKMLLEKLPENGYNISKTARQVGYSEQTSRSGNMYNQLRRVTGIEELYSIEGIKKIQKQALKTFKKAKDYSNTQRAIEHMGIIAGVKRVSEVDNKGQPDKVVIVYGTKSADNTQANGADIVKDKE